jgi:hypothetical protein
MAGSDKKGKAGQEQQLQKICRDTNKVANEHIKGMSTQVSGMTFRGGGPSAWWCEWSAAGGGKSFAGSNKLQGFYFERQPRDDGLRYGGLGCLNSARSASPFEPRRSIKHSSGGGEYLVCWGPDFRQGGSVELPLPRVFSRIDGLNIDLKMGPGCLIFAHDIWVIVQVVKSMLFNCSPSCQPALQAEAMPDPGSNFPMETN